MAMEIDHYYTQRDELNHHFPMSTTPASSSPLSRSTISTRDAVISKEVPHTTSNPSASSLGKIRIPPLCQRNLNHELLLGDPYELEEYDENDEQVDSFLESIALGTPRKVAGSKRVMRVQIMRQKMGIHPDQRNLAPGCLHPSQAQVFQSISAMNGLRESSFESIIATGNPPRPCAQPAGSQNGIRLIPPSFMPFLSPNPRQEMDLESDEVMSDAS
ncbi:hypothetical protein E1B28_010376 [Marasmius oreades]|uniref:Uncharacterized protein n=1 Tax=Marasmius oreades TaxID=181124 RepID=A0A9P7RX71_9AGAR|nr:uncharacterized protein E1B28_010376 [Marasmius oreades]KAG7091332.1 hypothetical protein E1B28_010376 [Marasmius oreades]